MADVFNFNIGNLSDFTRLFNQVKNNKFLRDTLIKGFPRFWNEFKEQQKSLNTLYGNTINTAKQAPSTISNKLGQVASTVRASKPVRLATTIAKSPVGKVLGRTAGTVGAALTEGKQVFNPDNSLKNRIITAAGIGMIPFNPVAGVGTLALANNERRVLQNNQPQAISQKQWEQNILNLNPNNLDPMLKPLNPGEVALFDAWRSNKRLDQELEQAPQTNQNTGYLGPQLFSQLESTSVPQEGLLSNVPIEDIQQSNQPALKSTTTSSLLTPNMIRGANQVELTELEDLTRGNNNTMVNSNDNILAPVPGQDTAQDTTDRQSGLELYAQILGEQRAQQALQQQAIADRYSNLINQYREAAELDRRQNQVNNLINALGNIVPDNRAPIYYVGADGGLNAIEVDQPSRNRMQLPSDTTANVERFKNIMALQQAQAEAQKAAQPDTLNDIRDLMIAQSLGNQYGVDPVTFLNTDYGKVLMQGQNTLQNTRLTGEERRKDIPLNVRGNIIEARDALANDLIRDEANNRATYERTLLTQTSENQRAMYNAKQAMDRLKTQGKISYAQAMDLETLRQNDPQGYLRIAANIVDAVNSAATPAEGYAALQNIINSMPQVKKYFNFGGNTQTGAPAVQNGQLTEKGMDIILRNKGR